MPLQAIERSQSDLVGQAQELYELQGLPPLLVSFFFHSRGGTVKKERRLELARDLARICAERLPATPGPCLTIERGPRLNQNLPEEISFILVQRIERGRGSWTCSEGGMVHQDARKLLQERIDEKAGKLLTYRERCDGCWLLLVAEAHNPSSFIEPDAASLEHTYQSPFERTYFLNFFGGQPVRLST